MSARWSVVSTDTRPEKQWESPHDALLGRKQLEHQQPPDAINVPVTPQLFSTTGRRRPTTTDTTKKRHRPVTTTVRLLLSISRPEAPLLLRVTVALYFQPRTEKRPDNKHSHTHKYNWRLFWHQTAGVYAACDVTWWRQQCDAWWHAVL